MRLWIGMLAFAACNESTISSRDATPTAVITSHVDGEAVERGVELALRGTVGDGDDDATTLVVTWWLGEVAACGPTAPADTGETACALVLDALQADVTLEVRDPDGHAATDRIALYAAATTTGPDPIAPRVDLVEPTSGAVVPSGAPLLLEAEADDPDGPEADLAWRWTSDVDGELSTDPGDDGGHASAFVTLTDGPHAITVTVTDVDGLTGTDVIAVTVDGGPTAPEVAISPDPPATVDDLRATLVAESVDPSDPVTYAWAWTVDGVPVPDLTADTVPADRTARDETWTVTVTPTAGAQEGPPAVASVTVANTAPEAPAIRVDPASPVEGMHDLRCAVDADAPDADDDAITYVMTWDVDGAPYAGDDGTWPGDSVPAAATAAGEVWTCTATPHDGELDGPPATASATIQAGAVVGCPDASCALWFDGVDDVVEVPHDAGLDGAGLPLTVEAWVRYADIYSGCMTAVRKGTSASATYDYWLHKNWAPEDSTYWGSWTGFTVVSFGVVRSSAWHHLAGVYDPSAGEARMYVDGVEVGAQATVGAPTANTDPLRIGLDWDDGCPMYGEIDEVRVSSVVRYSASFTPATILSADADTLALYRFEAYTGSIAYDWSGNGHDGVISGALWTTASP